MLTALFTAGSSILIPTPAGTVKATPSTKTSRWAWTWCWSVSWVSGTSPAATVRAMGSGGAGQWASVDGVGVVVADDESELSDDEHPPASRPMVMSTSTVRRVTGGLYGQSAHRTREARVSSARRAAWPSGLGKGLQSPVQRFDSARRLQ